MTNTKTHYYFHKKKKEKREEEEEEGNEKDIPRTLNFGFGDAMGSHHHGQTAFKNKGDRHQHLRWNQRDIFLFY